MQISRSKFRIHPLLVGLFVGLSAVLLMLPGLASAATISAETSVLHGAPVTATLTIDDAAQPGDLVITLELAETNNIGDFRGLFLQIADESLLAGLSVTGSDITASVFAANAVNAVSPSVSLAATGSPCPCDIGVEIGVDGIAGGDDFQTVSFILSHASASLDVSLFQAQDFGILVGSIGRRSDGLRKPELVTKLEGMLPIPEPTTAMLMMLGLSGLAAAGGRAGRQARTSR